MTFVCNLLIVASNLLIVWTLTLLIYKYLNCGLQILTSYVLYKYKYEYLFTLIEVSYHCEFPWLGTN